MGGVLSVRKTCGTQRERETKSQREEKDRKLLSLGVAKGQGLSEVSAALYMNL